MDPFGEKNFLLDYFFGNNQWQNVLLPLKFCFVLYCIQAIVRGARDSRATLMPIYGDLYQITL